MSCKKILFAIISTLPRPSSIFPVYPFNVRRLTIAKMPMQMNSIKVYTCKPNKLFSIFNTLIVNQAMTSNKALKIKNRANVFSELLNSL